MSLTAHSLLAGPRGRRLCLELLLWSSDDPEVIDARWAVSWAAQRLADNPGTVLTVGSGTAWSAEPEVSPAEVAVALARVQLPDLTAARLEEALLAAVDHAAYWQPPYGEDVLAATEEVREVLEPAAAAVAGSPHTRWWRSTLDRYSQARVLWEDERPSNLAPDDLSRRWRDRQQAEEIRFAQETGGVQSSGSWWSTPTLDLPRSTRVRDRTGPVGLSLVEDSLGWTSARVQPIAPPSGEVIEIAGPRDWAALCHRHPFVLTASRRTVWGWTTGRHGAWVQPDWSAVARDAAGVHLSIAGYLATAGRVIDLGRLGASVVAGWGPDETFWFEAVAPSAPAQEWAVDDSLGERRWQRV